MTPVSLKTPSLFLVPGTCCVFLAIYYIIRFLASPVRHAINYRLTDILYAQAKVRSCADLTKLLESGFTNSFGRPFYAILCSARHASSFSLDDALNREFHYDRFPEYLPYKQPSPYKKAFAHRIRQGVDGFLPRLSEETPGTLRELWGEQTTWQRREVALDMPYIIGRVGARIFVGEELCRNRAWLEKSQRIARTTHLAAVHLQLVPSVLRPIARYALPSCRGLKESTRDAQRILDPVLERRRGMKKRGEAGTVANDAIEWFEQIGFDNGFTDPVHPQLQLVLASTLTTGDFFTQVVNNLCLYPDTIDSLRREAVAVVKKHDGLLSIAALKELQRLDSVLKETMRLKPTSPVIMERKAVRDVTFADGTHIPKDTYVVLSQLQLWDDAVFPNASTFEPERFLGKSQFVTMSTDFLPFGYGARSCAGRFFASSQMKIALVHMLLKYDFKLAEGSVVPSVRGLPVGDYIMADNRVVMDVRKRTDENSALLP